MRTELVRTAPEAVGLNSGDIDLLLDSLAESGAEMHGIMIARCGKVCAEGWWAPYAPGIVHGLQSHTKTYAAAAVGIAVTQGTLRLDDRIVDIFPDKAPAEIDANLTLLTVRDVLAMGCGMDTMPRPSEHWIADFLATPVVHRPGSVFMYNSMGSTLLCAIVERATGRTTSDFLRTELFGKIGIDATKLIWDRMPDGTEIGGGGLFATTEDNLRLMMLYANGGTWDGERILSEEYVRAATSLQNDSATEAKGIPDGTDNVFGYGFQIWMCRPHGVYRADGAMGQFTIVDPKHEMVIAITETAAGARRAQATLDIVWEYLERVDVAEPARVADQRTAERLNRRLRHLSLAAPRYAPLSSLASRIHGIRYRLADASFDVHLTGSGFMSGRPPLAPVREFVLRFASSSAELILDRGARTERLCIATDGGREANTVESPTATRVLLSGHWESPTRFVVLARWIETCYEKRIEFDFGDASNVRIRTTMSVGSLLPFTALEEVDDVSAIPVVRQ